MGIIHAKGASGAAKVVIRNIPSGRILRHTEARDKNDNTACAVPREKAQKQEKGLRGPYRPVVPCKLSSATQLCPTPIQPQPKVTSTPACKAAMRHLINVTIPHLMVGADKSGYSM